jgi:hypothetical protein
MHILSIFSSRIKGFYPRASRDRSNLEGKTGDDSVAVKRTSAFPPAIQYRGGKVILEPADYESVFKLQELYTSNVPKNIYWTH